jgi:hypothetical protein
MDVALDKTRGFERNDPRWHCRIEVAETVDEVLMLVRDYIASLAPQHFMRLPDVCRGLRVKAEDDIEYWTFRLSQRPALDDGGQVDGELLQEVFNHFLHASLRISQIRRLEAGLNARQH